MGERMGVGVEMDVVPRDVLGSLGVLYVCMLYVHVYVCMYVCM